MKILLLVPFGDEQQTFVARFGPETGTWMCRITSRRKGRDAVIASEAPDASSAQARAHIGGDCLGQERPSQ
jgi:hypothetical protein